MGAEAVGTWSLGVPIAGVHSGMGCEGVVGRKSLALGTGPIEVSMSVTQSNRCGSHALLLTVRVTSRISDALL